MQVAAGALQAVTWDLHFDACASWPYRNVITTIKRLDSL